jgi:hypothetical protein
MRDEARRIAANIAKHLRVRLKLWRDNYDNPEKSNNGRRAACRRHFAGVGAGSSHGWLSLYPAALAVTLRYRDRPDRA